MATNIGASATMTVTNMKPAAGEQVDSLWGQNIADNTGYLRARPVSFFNTEAVSGIATTTTSGTLLLISSTPVYVYRTPGHNKIRGTFTMSGTFTSSDAPDMAYTFGPFFRGDLVVGGTNLYHLTGTTSNIGSTHTAGSTWALDLDVSGYVSEGSFGTFEMYFYGRLTDFVATNTVTMNRSYPLGLLTYWG